MTSVCAAQHIIPHILGWDEVAHASPTVLTDGASAEPSGAPPPPF